MAKRHGTQCACVYCRCEIAECSIEVGDSSISGCGRWWFILRTQTPDGEYSVGGAYRYRRSAVRRAKEIADKFRWKVVRVFDYGDEE